MEYLYTSLLVSLFACGWTYTIPDVMGKALDPHGFRLSIPHEPEIQKVRFHLQKGRTIVLAHLKNQKWIFKNHTSLAKAGREISFMVEVITTSGYYAKDGTAVLCDNLTYCCKRSTTTVNGKSACEGAVIFKDKFDVRKINLNVWSQEVRIPLEADDGQFVSFRRLISNSNLKNGALHIRPTLSSKLPDYDNTTLDLGSECTGIFDRSRDCVRRVLIAQVIPPIASVRINTKFAFSFRYGKVEIRAKLPRGDWLFPLILLEPLENYYGTMDYASGQIRIAFSRGNAILVDKTGKDISSKWLSGGVVLTSSQELRDTFLRGINTGLDLSDDFHIYTLLWTEEHLVFGVDGKDYGIITGDFSQVPSHSHGSYNSSSNMAPFDREFFLTLGVSAGGHFDFPEGCLNGPERTPKPWKNLEPKAELSFWRDRANWAHFLESSDSSLQVDYVKVFAL